MSYANLLMCINIICKLWSLWRFKLYSENIHHANGKCVYIYVPRYLFSQIYLFEVVRRICIQVCTQVYIQKDLMAELAVFWTLRETKWFRWHIDKLKNRTEWNRDDIRKVKRIWDPHIIRKDETNLRQV